MDIEHLDFSFGLQPIFQDVSIHISDGDHVGVVGVNGAGKSTLFHLILKDLEPDYGKIKLPSSARLAYLPQVLKDEISNMNCTVLEYMETGRPLKKLEDDLKYAYEKASVEDEKKSLFYLKQAGQIQSLIDFYDPYHAEEALLEIADGLHILDLLDESLKNLSGGQKSKVAFAHLLYSKPDLILLDEPTNHLDVESKSYVMNYLKNYRGTILVISHDIAFLNEVTNKTLYLDKLTHKMELFSGSFENFKRRKEEEKSSKARLIEKQERENIDILNTFRENHGKSVLEWEELLAESAKKHCIDMAENGYFAHDSLNGDTHKDRILSTGIRNTIAWGENIVAGRELAVDTFHLWINSEGHRVNMLRDNFTHVGIASIYKEGSVYDYYSGQNFVEKKVPEEDGKKNTITFYF